MFARSVSLTAAAVLASTALVAPLAAQAAPAAAGSCAVSGMVKKSPDGKALMVCVKGAAGKLSWGSGIVMRPGKPSLSTMGTWAKATSADPSAKMSAAFGMVENTSSSSVRIVAASSPYAKAVQLHEVVMKDGQMVMQEKAGGFLVTPNGKLELKPGGNHMMFIGLTKAIVPGKKVPVTLYTADGKALRAEFLAKVFSGGNEEYPSHGAMGVLVR